MTDFIHMDNIIQGEVMRIRERRPLPEQIGMLDALHKFLNDQKLKIAMEMLQVSALLEPDPDAAQESAVEDEQG